MNNYMLDTSAIGQIEAGDVSMDLLRTSTDQFYITHIQEDELAQAGDYAEPLLEVVETVAATEVSTESMMWSISKWGASKWGSGKHLKTILEHMNEDDGNEAKDALIAETAICNNYILVTHDRELRDIVNEKTPGNSISIPEFRNKLS